MRLSEARLRIFLTLATPPLLLLLAWGAWTVGAPALVTTALLVMGAGFGYLAAFDFPTSFQVDADGIELACLLRRRLVPWPEVSAIVQPRRRGLFLLTKDRKRLVLLGRELDSDEVGFIEEQARVWDVRVEI